MPGPISGISKSSLWAAWKEVRTEVKNSTVRDVVDFLDYDIDPDIWIVRLLNQIKNGSYEPQTPLRFTLAKSGGFKRRLTFPAIPDIVLFRAVANFVQKKAQRQQQPHVYYRRVDLKRAAAGAAQGTAQYRNRFASIYKFTSKQSFQNWREYEQYRKLLILRKIHRFIVVSDITNFFDSVLHSEVSNALRNFPIPSRLIGLLFFLLERLAIRADFSDSPRIGLPVDEFECSRTIANLVLFSHDRAMVSSVGKDAYVRWMDDQAVGVNSRSQGLRIVSAMGASLANLYLTANTKKTRILSLKEAKLHFHLEANGQLDIIENLIAKRAKPRRTLVRRLARGWRLASQNKDQGEWEKIQKRYYRLAGLLKAKFFRSRAPRDLLKTPTLAERIADYMRCSGSVREYIRFVRRILAHKEQVYEDVEFILIESLLRLEARTSQAKVLTNLGLDVLEDVISSRKNSFFASPGCLLVLRFGGRSGKSRLRRFFRETKVAKHVQLVRASSIAYATYGRAEFTEVRRAAAFLLNNPLALMVRMVKRVQKLQQVPDRFKARLNLRYDAVAGRPYLDMRTYVAGRLLRLNKRKGIRNWLQQWAKQMTKKRLSRFDRKLLKRAVA
jgi:hypothetical protein